MISELANSGDSLLYLLMDTKHEHRGTSISTVHMHRTLYRGWVKRTGLPNQNSILGLARCQTCPEVAQSLNSFHLHPRHIHGVYFQASSVKHVSYSCWPNSKLQPPRTTIRKEEWERRLREVQVTKE